MKKPTMIFAVLTVLLFTLFISGCASGIKAGVKFGAGMLTEAIVHQGGQYGFAKISGADVKWRDGSDYPGFQFNAQIRHKGPAPLAYGGGLLTVALTSATIMWGTNALNDEEGKNFFTDFLMGYLTMASFDLMNYGTRRSGFFGDHDGEGQNDLSLKNFGGYHKAAGALAAAYGATVAYKVATSKRAKGYWKNFKLWINGLSGGFSYVF